MSRIVGIDITRLQNEIDGPPFSDWPTRELQGIVCELLESLPSDYDSRERLQALLSVQARITKAVGEAFVAYHSKLESCAGRAVYYATGYSLTSESCLADSLNSVSEALESKRRQI